MFAQHAHIQHSENFPVASLLCPPGKRPAVVALYRFARAADDLADEGDATPAQRLAALAAYRTDLDAVLQGKEPSDRWPHIFHALFKTILACDADGMSGKALPDSIWSIQLHALLDAFEKDVRDTAAGFRYRTRAELLAYCQLSANPVGRLMLHIFGVHDQESQRQSDAICSSLQLINFWQDVSRDVPRGRFYVIDEPMRDLVAWARTLMLSGQPLCSRVRQQHSWRFGAELALVVQGGLRILDKIERQGFDTSRQRPRLTLWDVPIIGFRACKT